MNNTENNNQTNGVTFVDRQVEYPNRYTVEKINSDGTKETFVADIVRNPGTVICEGTALNAYNINNAFAEKQDKLTAGAGIEINDNVISLKEERHGIGYEHIAQDITGINFMAEINKTEWKATPESTSPLYGAWYFYQVDNADIEYSDAIVEFEVSDIIYDTSIDADPTACVRFSSANGNILCSYNFVKNRVVLRKGSDWSEYGRASVSFESNSGVFSPFKVRVCRRKLANGNFKYRMYLNGNLCHEMEIEDNYDYASIKIGTIGCKATLKYWKAEGSL